MIRPATPNDAPKLSQLIVIAMGSLANSFVNGRGNQEALLLFERFAAERGNQYSFENTLVYDSPKGVQGMVCAYNGKYLHQLRQPFLTFIQHKYGFSGSPEDETQEGEYYIDCLCVAPEIQGKGIGKQLINALIDKGRSENWPAIGLLVTKDNPQAQKLYTSLGFVVKGEKELLGTDNRHMQYELSNSPA